MARRRLGRAQGPIACRPRRHVSVRRRPPLRRGNHYRPRPRAPAPTSSKKSRVTVTGIRCTPSNAPDSSRASTCSHATVTPASGSRSSASTRAGGMSMSRDGGGETLRHSPARHDQHPGIHGDVNLDRVPPAQQGLDGEADLGGKCPRKAQCLLLSCPGRIERSILAGYGLLRNRLGRRGRMTTNWSCARQAAHMPTTLFAEAQTPPSQAGTTGT